MIPVLSREKMQAFDRQASEQALVPSLLLMENAGRGACDVIVELLRAGRAGGVAGAPVLIVCGGGNNGGDGLVVARRLLTLGAAPRVLLCAERARLGGDARTNADAWVALGGTLTEVSDDAGLAALAAELGRAALVVDALLGTGLDREVVGLQRQVIEQLNGAAAPIVALDLPSGLDANTGAVLGVAVRATATVTFAVPKPGLFGTVAAEHVGVLHVADIGVPVARAERLGVSAEVLEVADVRRLVVPRAPGLHKGTAGRVLVLAGSAGKTGAALLVAQGAFRAGAGLVTLANYPDAIAQLESRVLEAMTAPIDRGAPERELAVLLARADAIVIGPGLGLDAAARRLVDYVVLRHDGPVVVDADALTLFEGSAEELMAAAGPRLLTPHAAELGRLLGVTAADVEADRLAAVARCCELSGAVVLLKGRHTLIGAPDVPPVIHQTDCPALATGGAGDVLAGVCGAWACHLTLREAAQVAAFLHGRAAERWSRETGADRGLLAHEVADRIPVELAQLLR